MAQEHKHKIHSRVSTRTAHTQCGNILVYGQMVKAFGLGSKGYDPLPPLPREAYLVMNRISSFVGVFANNSLP